MLPFPSLAPFLQKPSNPSQDADAHTPKARTPGLLRVLFDLLIEARQREAEEQIERLAERSSSTQFSRRVSYPSHDNKAPAPAERKPGLLSLLADALSDARKREADEYSKPVKRRKAIEGAIQLSER